jgi:hypothetical protein
MSDLVLGALHRVALMAERYAERLDRVERSYESTQLLQSARSLVRACELFITWKEQA